MRSSVGAPRGVVLFFVKALLVFIAWKAIYLLWFKPKGILDTPLTSSVGVSTVFVLNAVTSGASFEAVRAFPSVDSEDAAPGGVMDIYRNGESTLRIANACNALEVMALYAGFLLCYPAPPRRRLGFLGVGLLSIFLINIIRCTLLVEIFIHYRAYLDFSHHFAFTFIVYSCIFFLWYRYTRKDPASKIQEAMPPTRRERGVSISGAD